MRKIIFALALALPLTWSMTSFAADPPADDTKKEDTTKKDTKKAKKGEKKADDAAKK